ncbi:MAG: orotidine-5'-phosphate decarboxylase [Endomicrobium sp.]|uniref:orotidine-5'-phosphate decarboxylase n=1 Tax=Candidatus Endomicrobiellum pyrsonymphae TaxID=1408203 RepID=UPI003582F42A|nr:orotidine-5'-phosphate decarboxylase [Endomicrobium sp.]MCA6072194.1 orotidine-5'-phosphate decarboxylase [Endomicrobium sp.]
MKKIILALDVYDFKKAEKLVKETSPYIDVYKVGPILFLQSGKEIIKMIKDNGKEVFLDLKFHDIPVTVKRSVESARELGVFSLTTHSIGGEEMLKAAAAIENRPKIWAVTVLTSQIITPEEVTRRAKLTKSCGIDGVISSPLEIALIKKECGKDFNVVTPGIRLLKVNDDQKRVATPEVAIKEGADFIVVGRPILEAENPAEATKNIYERTLIK